MKASDVKLLAVVAVSAVICIGALGAATRPRSESASAIVKSARCPNTSPVASIGATTTPRSPRRSIERMATLKRHSDEMQNPGAQAAACHVLAHTKVSDLGPDSTKM